MVQVRKNLTGQKFGRLNVLCQTDDYIQPNGKHKAQYYCLCDCGNYCTVQSYHLTSGLVQSCGCLNIEKLIKRSKKYNNYNLSEEYGIGLTTNTNIKFYFDLEDYDLMKEYSWRENKDGYIYSDKTINHKHHTIFMHDLVMKIKPNTHLMVDHKFGHKYDNRKSQLRLATAQQNVRNSKVSKNNTSGTTGVVWISNINKWYAYIGVNYKRINLGYFKNKQDAINARKEAEIKYFGEFTSNYNNDNYMTNNQRK